MILSFLSCRQSEDKKVYYFNGTHIVEEIKYYKNSRDTLSLRKEDYYKSGNKFYTGSILNGEKVGTWIWWYENGQKKDQCQYADGFYIDTIYHWYSNGRLKQIEVVPVRAIGSDESCNCNGLIIRYNENGKIEEKFNALHGKLQGTYSTYKENGGWVTVIYENDTLSGPTLEHLIDSAGLTHIIVGQYKQGKKTGLWKWFNKDSILNQTAIYENGKVQDIIKR
jgi:uncharacterized protein